MPRLARQIRPSAALFGRAVFGWAMLGCVALGGQAEAAEAARSRAEARLERAGFEVVGAPRRKGDFLIVTATRESVSWRLVVDGRSGEIVGQKPIGLATPAD